MNVRYGYHWVLWIPLAISLTPSIVVVVVVAIDLTLIIVVQVHTQVGR